MNVALLVSAVGAIVGPTVTVYVNGPRRKRILEELTVLDRLQDPGLAQRLRRVIEADVERYLRRRTRSRLDRFSRVVWLSGAIASGLVALFSLAVRQPAAGALGALGVATNSAFILQLRRSEVRPRESLDVDGSG